MPDSMIERMARTYYERTNGAYLPDCCDLTAHPRFIADPWEAASIKDRDHHLANARAVLTAMRGVTETMVSATDASVEQERVLCREIWDLMIDAALAEDGR